MPPHVQHEPAPLPPAEPIKLTPTAPPPERHLNFRWPTFPQRSHNLFLFGQSRLPCAVEPHAWHVGSIGQRDARCPG